MPHGPWGLHVAKVPEKGNADLPVISTATAAREPKQPRCERRTGTDMGLEGAKKVRYFN